MCTGTRTVTDAWSMQMPPLPPAPSSSHCSCTRRYSLSQNHRGSEAGQLTCTVTASMRDAASEGSHAAEVKARDTQLNKREGQGGGSGAGVPSHARLVFRVSHERECRERGAWDVCECCGLHLALGMRMPGSCMFQPREAAKDMRRMLQFDNERILIASHGL